MKQLLMKEIMSAYHIINNRWFSSIVNGGGGGGGQIPLPQLVFWM